MHGELQNDLTYAVSNPHGYRIAHANESQCQKNVNRLQEIPVKRKIQRRRKQNGANQFSFRCHKPYMRKGESENRNTEKRRASSFSKYQCVLRIDNFTEITCPDDNGFAIITRLSLALKNFSATKYNVLPL